jgi:hypothetical protein
MNWKGCGRKQLCHNLRYHPSRFKMGTSWIKVRASQYLIGTCNSHVFEIKSRKNIFHLDLNINFSLSTSVMPKGISIIFTRMEDELFPSLKVTKLRATIIMNLNHICILDAFDPFKLSVFTAQFALLRHSSSKQESETKISCKVTSHELPLSR